MKNLKWVALALILLVCKSGFSWVKICGNHTNQATGTTQTICFAGGGKCDDEKLLVNATWFYPGGWTCVDGIASTQNDHVKLIKKRDGSADVVVNGQKTPVFSDSFIDFMKKLQQETANKRVSSQVIQSQFDAFFDTDNGRVSDARLQSLSAELGVPIEDRSKNIMTLRNIRRDGVLMSDPMQRMVFNPNNSRGMTNVNLKSMDRDLTGSDKVFVVQPTGYAVLNAEKTNDWGIGYFWEILSTDQGILIAVPIPNIGSYGRVPVVCPCDSKHYGTCSSNGFCFYNIEPDRCTMKPMKEEDPKICIVLRNAQNGSTEVNFINTFLAESGGRMVTVAMRGMLSSEPTVRNIWASSYLPGVGCFLEETTETTNQNKRKSASKIRHLLSTSGIVGAFEPGVKAVGIR